MGIPGEGDWTDQERGGTGKFDPKSVEAWIELLLAIRGVLKEHGVPIPKREGYDPAKDSPRDKDTGESLH